MHIKCLSNILLFHYCLHRNSAGPEPSFNRGEFLVDPNFNVDFASKEVVNKHATSHSACKNTVEILANSHERRHLNWTGEWICGMILLVNIHMKWKSIRHWLHLSLATFHTYTFVPNYSFINSSWLSANNIPNRYTCPPSNQPGECFWEIKFNRWKQTALTKPNPCPCNIMITEYEHYENVHKAN